MLCYDYDYFHDCSHMKKCYKMQRCSHNIDLIMSSSYLCVKTTWWFLVSLPHHIFLHNLSSSFALKCHNFSQSSFFHFFHNVHQIVMFISFPNLFLCIVLFCHHSIFTMFIFFLLIFLCCFFLMYSCVLNGFTIIPFSLIFIFIVFQIIKPIRPSFYPNFMVTL